MPARLSAGRIAALAFGTLLLLAVVALLLAWRPVLATVDPPRRSDIDPATLTRGANLAALGNCAVCHTRREGPPLAGGVEFATDFGTIYSTNITPDPSTGLGGWSEAAFVRALRDGVSRDGHRLYPAFPYDHYTRLTDADLHDLYAWVMTRTPTAAMGPPNRMKFPFGFRPLLAGWQLLFLRHEPVNAEPRQSAEWNRGAYLAQALGHCGACHTPRNRFGAERRERPLDGGEAEGWYAPPLGARSPSPQPWTVPALTAYLRRGIVADHAMAGGPMQEVVGSLGDAAPADVEAIATWIHGRMQDGASATDRRRIADASAARASRPLAAGSTPGSAADDGLDRQAPAGSAAGASSTGPGDDAATLALGATVYAGACASCHDQGRGPSSNAALRLPLAVAVYDEDPRSLLKIIRGGITPLPGRSPRLMPAFGHAIDDRELTALAAYLRRAAADLPPWPRLADVVRETGRASPRTTPSS